MRKFFATLGFLAASTASADPVSGLWKTQPDDQGRVGHVDIAPCGDTLCGTLVGGSNAQGQTGHSTLYGRKIIWDMKPEGNGAYGGGKIWSPDRDQTYSAKMTLDGNRLKVSGCVAVICRSQTWTRIEG